MNTSPAGNLENAPDQLGLISDVTVCCACTWTAPTAAHF